MKDLHKQVEAHFARTAGASREGLSVLDFGCGLVCEPLAPRGMRYLPVVHRASWIRDTSVNYIAAFAQSDAVKGRA